jgi:hypothetical protein
MLLVHWLTWPVLKIDGPSALILEEEWFRLGDRHAACRAMIICDDYGLPTIPNWANPEAAELAREELGLPRTKPRERGPHGDYSRRRTERQYQIAACTAVKLARENGYRDHLAYEYALKALHRSGFERIYTSEETLQVVYRRVLNWPEPPEQGLVNTCQRSLQIEFDNIRAEEDAERRRRE